MKRLLFLSSLFLFSCEKELIVPISVTTQNTETTQFAAVKVDSSFSGFKVAPNVKQLGKDYWLNTPIFTDLCTSVFKKLPNGYSRYGLFMYQMAVGDFNNDGYADIFDGGVSFNGPKINASFLIWNPTKLIFEDVSLFNDKTIQFITGNITKTIPTYVNDDNYVDLVLFGTGDEGIGNSPYQPVSIVLSDGKGGYDLKNIVTNDSESPLWKIESGDVGDMNGDGVNDLVVVCNMFTYIYWGIKEYPYFTQKDHATFVGDGVNFSNYSNNGFGEKVNQVAGNAFSVKIIDINKDNKNDLIVSKVEDRNHDLFPMQSKILYNMGGGKFNDKGIVNLPFFYNDNSFGVQNIDYIVDDLNNDGLNDLICVNQQTNRKTNTWAPWELFVYEQQKDGSFTINKNYFGPTQRLNGDDWKSSLIYYDYNNDGIKDVGYVNAADNDGIMKSKTVFIREGNKFIEKDLFQYYGYKTLFSKLK